MSIDDKVMFYEMMNNGGFLTMAFVVLYPLPWIIAMFRRTKNRASVAIVNIFLGWSILGWFVALAMAGGEKREA